MSKLKFSPEEVEILKEAYTLGHQGWNLDKLTPIKQKIKAKKRLIQGETCCYCLRDTTGEAKMVLDIEHILPKSLRPRNMFTMKNLAISCKRCNLQIKKTKTNFLTVPITQLPKRAFKSRFYRFVHPNLDYVESHIERVFSGRTKSRIVKYVFPETSAKGRYTYEYFKLKELEVDTANNAQGRRKRKTIKDERIRAAFDALTQD